MARADIDIIQLRVIKALDACDLGDSEVRVTVEVLEPSGEVLAKADPMVERVLKQETKIFKTEEERYVLGVVLEPLKELGKVDSQNDLYSAEEVRQAAYKFMEYYGTLGLQHKANAAGRVKLLENWISRNDEVINGEVVKAGTWLMGIRVVEDELWSAVKAGKITGLSIGGFAERKPVVDSQKN